MLENACKRVMQGWEKEGGQRKKKIKKWENNDAAF